MGVNYKKKPRRKLDAIAKTIKEKKYDAAWEKGFLLLKKFKEREGHCRVPYHYEIGASKFRLGIWVRTQRSAMNSMVASRRDRLDALGFVWDPMSEQWENGFSCLATFKARWGHCFVPQRHIEGRFRLGAWVNQQRAKIKILSAARKRRLREIGFIWNTFSTVWDRGFAALVVFRVREGHCDVSQRHIEGSFALGRWVNQQRAKKRALSAHRRFRLNAIGFVWRAKKQQRKALSSSRRTVAPGRSGSADRSQTVHDRTIHDMVAE